MRPKWKEWKSRMEGLSENKAEFEKWLFVHTAGVLFGGKAGELLTLTAGQCGLSIDKQTGLIKNLSSIWKFLTKKNKYTHFGGYKWI